MAKKSDFAQKLLDDIRIRKQRMAAGNQLQPHSGKYPQKPYQRAKDTTTNLEIASRENRPALAKQKAILAEKVSGDIVPFKGHSNAKHDASDFSMALTFALENTTHFSRVSISGNPITRRQSVDFGDLRNSSVISDGTDYYASGGRFPASSNLYIGEISRGAQRLNQILKACSRGLNLDRHSVQVGRELLKGAIDLEESLRMLVSLQEASEDMVNPRKKKNFPLIQDGGSDDTHENNNRIMILHKSKFSADKLQMEAFDLQQGQCATQHKSKMQANQSILELVSRHPWATSDWLSKEPVRAFSGIKADTNSDQILGSTNLGTSTGPGNNNMKEPKISGSQQEKRIPNVIAKLMGLDEFPPNTDSKNSGAKNLPSSKGGKSENLTAKAQISALDDIVMRHYKEKNVVPPPQSVMVPNADKSKSKDSAASLMPDKVIQNPSTITFLKENKICIDVSRKTSKAMLDPEEKEANAKLEEQHILGDDQKKVSKFKVSDKTVGHESINWQNGERTTQLKKEKKTRAQKKLQETVHDPDSCQITHGKQEAAEQITKRKLKAKDVNGEAPKRLLGSGNQTNVQKTSHQKKRGTSSKGNIKEQATSKKMTIISDEQKPQNFEVITEIEVAGRIPPVVLMKPVAISYSPNKVDRKQVYEIGKSEIMEADTKKSGSLHLVVQVKQEDSSVREALKKRRQETMIKLKGTEDNIPITSFAEKYEPRQSSPSTSSKCPVEDDFSTHKKADDTIASKAEIEATTSIINAAQPLTNILIDDQMIEIKNQRCQDTQDKETNDHDKANNSNYSQQLWKAILTKHESQNFLTEEENSLKQILLMSQQFLNTAEALFELHIPVEILYHRCQINQDEGSKLLFDCAYEVMKRKGKREETLFGFVMEVPNPWTQVRCLNDLVKELHKDVNILKTYSDHEGDEYDAAVHMHKILEKDIQNKNADVNSMWDFDWNYTTFACHEKHEVVRDVEKHLINRLVDEITGELLQVGMSRQKGLLATRY